MGKDYTYIGKTIKRRDSEDIVTGSARFLDDLSFQNLLHGILGHVPEPLDGCRGLC